MKKQKFQIGSKVKIDKDLGEEMRHFTCDINAIVQYTYAQKYGGSSIDIYSLVLLDNKDIPYNTSAWYYENQLTLLDEDLTKGRDIIDLFEYDLKHKNND